MKTLVKGTIESIEVDVFDRNNTIDDISGLSPKFDVRQRTGTDWLIQGNDCVADGLVANCLIDTTPDEWVPEVYQLFLYFDNTPETPRIGPLEFKVAHAMPEVSSDTPQP
jgi:hypothetical protein